MFQMPALERGERQPLLEAEAGGRHQLGSIGPNDQVGRQRRGHCGRTTLRVILFISLVFHRYFICISSVFHLYSIVVVGLTSKFLMVRHISAFNDHVYIMRLFHEFCAHFWPNLHKYGVEVNHECAEFTKYCVDQNENVAQGFNHIFIWIQQYLVQQEALDET